MARPSAQPQKSPHDEGRGGRSPTAANVMALTQGLMRQMVALAGDLAATSGLNPSDLAALRALDAAAGEGIAVNTLGAQLGLSSGAVTALVDRLEGHELVKRTRHSGDRRKVLVTLAPKARTFGAEHLVPLAHAISAATDQLTEPELAAVERYLQTLLDTNRTELPSTTAAPP